MSVKGSVLWRVRCTRGVLKLWALGVSRMQTSVLRTALMTPRRWPFMYRDEKHTHDSNNFFCIHHGSRPQEQQATCDQREGH